MCAGLKSLMNTYYINNKKYLTYSDTTDLRENRYTFWRVSSNKNIVPYVQKNAVSYKSLGNTLSYDTRNNVTRAFIPVLWVINNVEYNKGIYLANLILFNRNYFGYTTQNFKIDNLNEKWTSIVKNEYRIANIWSEILTVLYKNGIPCAIIRDICLTWGGLTSFV